jgi:D-xylose transport system permease protein
MSSLKQESSIGEILSTQINNNMRQYAMFIALLGVWILFGILTNGIFFTPRNMSTLLLQTSYIAVLAVGMVLVIVAGHIDLSVGSIAGFIGAIAAISQVSWGFNTLASVALALVMGVIVGLWQGYWIAYQRIPAFIVTLAGMTIFRGLLILVTGGATIVPKDPSFRLIGQGFLPKLFLPDAPFHDFTLIIAILAVLVFLFFSWRKRESRKKYGFTILPTSLEIAKNAGISVIILLFFSIMIFYKGLPFSILIIIGLVLFYSFLSNNTVFGRHVYAIGGNKEAARLSGINIKQRTLMIFVSMGVLSALSGIVVTARLNAAQAAAGNLFELDTIAAAIIGGTSTLGGEGTVFGAIIGALLMSSVNNGMGLLNLDSATQMIFRGLILLLAVWFDIKSRKKA